MNADLHCHSYYSDGLLAPAEVMQRAQRNGVEMITLSDHDEIAGLDEARESATALGMHFVNGVEISVSWGNDHTIHIVGLGFDADNPALVAGLQQVRVGRDERAALIGRKLDEHGFVNAYAGAMHHARNPALVSRSHFARYIVDSGRARDMKVAFDDWLGRDRPAYVSHQWASLADAVGWITAAGGIAVVAHPGRYWMEPPEMALLLGEFRDLGGRAIEVQTSAHRNPDKVAIYADYARRFGFLASRASDFHGPDESWTDLGRLPELPPDLVPLWKSLI